MVEWQLPAELVAWTLALRQPLHGRRAWRLLPLLPGAPFARGRRTVASWLRAAGLGADFRQYYYFLGSLGPRAGLVAALLLRLSVRVLGPGDRLVFGLDDTPTKRAGPKVEGAGIHHNPTPGPADQKFLYGHVWVTRAWLYVRHKDVSPLPPRYRVAFRTKLEMAAAAVAWLADWLKSLGKTLWVVADGAYAKRPVLKAAKAAAVVVVSRLRRDAALWSVPVPPRPGAPKKRGPKPTYGKERLSLAKRAGHRRGWQTADFTLYGERVTKTFKTFLATSRPAGGLIRVVLVRERDGWAAFFCTDPNAPVAQILEAVADRAAVEQDFHDLKEVHGAGPQQVRQYWANVAVFHLDLWLHTLVELRAWAKTQGRLCDRRDSPWDQAERRPSHADRRNALRRLCVQTEIREAGRRRPLTRKLRALCRSLLKLATWA